MSADDGRHRPMSHHPLCMSLWSGEFEHCACPDVNTCRACPYGCRECTWQQETCECYTHAEPSGDTDG